MALHNLITLSNTSSTRLSPNGIHSGTDITLQNVNESGYIYVGTNTNVSSTDYGYRLSPNSAISFELPGQDSIYAIASNSNIKVAVLMTNLESGA
jgi:hypothetical protein